LFAVNDTPASDGDEKADALKSGKKKEGNRLDQRRKGS
jgi:hypothetical protein